MARSNYLPAVVRAKHVRDYVVDFTFNDGTRMHLDISQWFKGPVFKPLRDKSYFKKFFVETATIAWPNGVDIAPEALYDAEDVRDSGQKPSPRRKPGRRSA